MSHDCPPLSQGQSGCFQSFTIISAGQQMALFLQRDSLLGPKALPPVEAQGGEATVQDCHSPRPQSRRAPPSGNGGAKEDLRKPWASVTHLQSSVHPPIRLSVHPSIHPSIHLSVHPTTHPSVCPPTHPPICLSIHPSIRLSTHPPICLSIHPPICLPIHPPICLSIHPPICLSIQPPIRLSIHPPIHPPIHPSVCLSTCSSIIQTPVRPTSVGKVQAQVPQAGK